MKKLNFLVCVAVLVLVSTNSYGQHHDRGHGERGVVNAVPRGAVRVSYGPHYYHYYGGRFYEPWDRGFRIIMPPIGVIVPVLPHGSVTIVLGGRRYFMYDDVYYYPVDRGYEVVKPQTAADAPAATTTTASSSANEYKKIEIDGKTYYQKGDSYYKASVNDKGEIVYQSVGQVSKS